MLPRPLAPGSLMCLCVLSLVPARFVATDGADKLALQLSTEHSVVEQEVKETSQNVDRPLRAGHSVLDEVRLEDSAVGAMAGAQAAKAVEPSPDGKATIYVYRKKGYYESLGPAMIDANHITVVELPAGSYTAIEIPVPQAPAPVVFTYHFFTGNYEIIGKCNYSFSYSGLYRITHWSCPAEILPPTEHTTKMLEIQIESGKTYYVRYKSAVSAFSAVRGNLGMELIKETTAEKEIKGMAAVDSTPRP